MLKCCFICGTIEINGECPDRDCKRGGAGKYTKTQQDQLDILNAKFDKILQDILGRIDPAIGADGTTQDSKILALQAEYQQEVLNKKTERTAILNG